MVPTVEDEHDDDEEHNEAIFARSETAFHVKRREAGLGARFVLTPPARLLHSRESPGRMGQSLR